jgi:hypothetical protein
MPPYPDGVKEFAVYTGLRLVLFLATWAIAVGISLALTESASLTLTFLIAFVVSGIGSYFVLRGPRERLAQRVEQRAGRASAKLEEMRSKEDADGRAVD